MCISDGFAFLVRNETIFTYYRRDIFNLLYIFLQVQSHRRESLTEILKKIERKHRLNKKLKNKRKEQNRKLKTKREIIAKQIAGEKSFYLYIHFVTLRLHFWVDNNRAASVCSNKSRKPWNTQVRFRRASKPTIHFSILSHMQKM